MEDIIKIVLLCFGAFGWGLYAQEMSQKRTIRKEKERRIIVDAPFSPEQSDVILKVLAEISKSVADSVGR